MLSSERASGRGDAGRKFGACRSARRATASTGFVMPEQRFWNSPHLPPEASTTTRCRVPASLQDRHRPAAPGDDHRRRCHCKGRQFLPCAHPDLDCDLAHGNRCVLSRAKVIEAKRAGPIPAEIPDFSLLMIAGVLRLFSQFQLCGAAEALRPHRKDVVKLPL